MLLGDGGHQLPHPCHLLLRAGALCLRFLTASAIPLCLQWAKRDDFIKTGGMIRFVTQDKIRFEINDDAAKRAGLKISSKLLSYAIPQRALAPYFPFRTKLTLIYPPNGTRLASI